MSRQGTLDEANAGCCVLENELEAALGRAVERAELLQRRGRDREAAAVLLQAATLTESTAARRTLRRRSAELLWGASDPIRRWAC